MTDQRHDLEPRRASRAHHSRRGCGANPDPAISREQPDIQGKLVVLALLACRIPSPADRRRHQYAPPLEAGSRSVQPLGARRSYTSVRPWTARAAPNAGGAT